MTFALGTGTFTGQARIVEDAADDERARALVHDKYASTYGGEVSGWRGSALSIAVDLRHETTTTEGESR